MQTAPCRAAKALAGLGDGALTGVQGGGVDRQKAGRRGSGADARTPGEVGEPTARSGPAGSTAASGGWAGDALPDSPSPSRAPPHLRLPSQTRQLPTARSCSVQLLPEVARLPPRGTAGRPAPGSRGLAGAEPRDGCVATRAWRPGCARAQ